MLSCLQCFLISQKCPRNLAIYHVYELISDEKYVHIWFYNIFELHGRNFKLDVNTISNFHLEISRFYELSLCHFVEYFFSNSIGTVVYLFEEFLPGENCNYHGFDDSVLKLLDNL